MRIWPLLAGLLKGWLISFLVFSLLATVLVGQFAWSTSFSWKVASWMAFRDWFPWAFLTPFIFFLVGRLPLIGGRWKLSVPVHLACAFAVFALWAWWSETVPRRTPVWLGGRVESGGPARFSEGARDGRFPAPRDSPAARPEPPASGDPARERPRGGGGPRPGSGSGPGFSPWRSPFFVGFRLPIYLAILSVAHALYFYRGAQARERRSLELESGLTKARLEALRMQLQPHFLFNSLNAIAALIHKDPEAADEMVAALSDFLRLTLERPAEQEMPLRRELEFVERYLAIEKVRFGERLHFLFDIPADTYAALVPTLMLQPLVENAVRHGLEPKLAGGQLTITARREDERLVLRVADNGAGLQEPSPREGIGLHNTRARLSELYGHTATLEMRGSAGVEVRISLPFHTVAA